MTWADVSAATLRVLQQKTNAKLVIPIHHQLMHILEEASRDHVTIVNTEYGRPFTVAGFSQWMRAAIRAAGLPIDCQPHGLRKAAGRRLAEAGCTANEIMSVLGHKTLTEAERYTRAADQAGLPSQQCRSLKDRRRTESPKPTSKGLGKSRKAKTIQSEQIRTGGPERTRTSDLRFRKPLLYPAELRDHAIENIPFELRRMSMAIRSAASTRPAASGRIPPYGCTRHGSEFGRCCVYAVPQWFHRCGRRKLKIYEATCFA